MTNESWKNREVDGCRMALVIATVVATGLVVANWGGRESDKKAVDVSPGAQRRAWQPHRPHRRQRACRRKRRFDACNQSAAAQAGQRENTKDTVIAGAIGAVAGAAVGAAGGAVVAGGSGAGKGAVIGGLVGAGAALARLHRVRATGLGDESHRRVPAGGGRGEACRQPQLADSLDY